MGVIRRAILSVHDKSGLADLGRALADRGVEIVSTGGTAAHLADAGVPVTTVAEVTGAPEILGGRVKTLHPRIAGAILGRPEMERDRAELTRHDIDPFGLVVVNLYPFERTVADPACGLDEALENIDIGGPTMIRAAAKNHPRVAVVVDPGDYGAIVDEMDRRDGSLTDETRAALALKAFRHTAAYDAAIATFLGRDDGETFPPRMVLSLRHQQSLRYGENPHQAAALYVEPGFSGPSVATARQLGGKALSYNNLADADAALALVREFDRPAAVVIKHTNPCGAAVHDGGVTAAFRAAMETDPMSAFGGIVAVNRPVDLECAEAIAETFFEVVLAPGYAEDALARLQRKKKLRLLEIPAWDEEARGGPDLKRIRGGYLVTEWDGVTLVPGEVVTERRPTDAQRRALDLAWTLVKHVRSNAIVLANENQAVGIGAGQMSRVDAVEIAVRKARLPTEGAVLASDAFFPFRDGIDAAAAAGIAAVIQPGGSVRDPEVVAAADEHGLAMILTGMRHFKH